MQTPIVREFRDDILNKNIENQVRGEPFTTETPGLYTRIIVPVHSPFFIKSLKLYFKNGEPMTEEHWEIFKIMPGLTALAAQGVACMIRLKDPAIVEGLLDYDVVGEFTLFDTAMMNLVTSTTEDDRMIDFFNLKDRPLVFPPTLHPHSLLYDIMAFQDTIHLLDSLSEYSRFLGTPLIETKISQYFSNFNHYLALYKTQLMKFLADHKNTYNEHGIKAIQVGLEKVDNFETAVEPIDLLSGRKDMHLTVQGLATIVNQTGFDSGEYLAKGTLPISQFGNANFIPPSIDGSFEGFGGITETAAMCLEDDGSITFLWNRMDGRVTGLYYSVMTNAEDYTKTLLTYTGFKYEHPRFNVDGASVDRIAQGSGDEVILVGDSTKNLYYLGVTNGSLDPAKHVYSKVDLQPIVAAIFSIDVTPKYLFPFLSIALMGEWIYLIQSSTAGTPVPAGIGNPMNHKHFFRVRLADVQATIDVTPVKQNVSFINADGQQFTNSPFYRWYEQVLTADKTQTLKCLLTFNQPTNGVIGNYRSLPVWVAEDPSRKGIFAMKFLSAYYASQAQNGINQQLNLVPEINYDFDPNTGVMTLKSKTAIPPMVNWGRPDFYDPAYVQNISPFYGLVFTYAGQGSNVLADGRIVASGARGFSGFPRLGIQLQVVNAKSKYATVSKFFGRGFEELTMYGLWDEVISSPLESSINVRAMQYRPGGEFYIAAGKNVLSDLYLYWKDISGKFAYRPEVTNLYVPNIVSRPLTQAIRRVDCLPGIGGVTVSVPSSQLDAYGIEVGESMFCMSAQKKDYRYTDKGTGWTSPVGDNDILLISDFNRRVEQNGQVTIVPTKEILYSAAIVEQLKNQVEFPAIKNQARSCIVTVSDPTFSSLARFGWLPVTVVITYVNAEGTPDRDDMYSTCMTISPTYTDDANGRKLVTGFTLLDKYHFTVKGGAIDQIRIFNGMGASPESPQSTLGPMRTYYYLNGNSLKVHVNSGVIGNSTGDSYTTNHNFTYNDRSTQRWSSSAPQNNSSSGGGVFITPDNGIATMYDWTATTGGAGTIVNGAVNKPLVGSVYPEVGWAIFFKSDIRVAFNGKEYTLPAGIIDLRDIDPSPGNKVFYIYALLKNDIPIYEVTQEKRLENPFTVWVGKITTNTSQIITIERFNVFTINGSRISEIKRGNSIPATSGLVNAEGQIPWLRSDEMLQ